MEKDSLETGAHAAPAMERLGSGITSNDLVYLLMPFALVQHQATNDRIDGTERSVTQSRYDL